MEILDSRRVRLWLALPTVAGRTVLRYHGLPGGQARQEEGEATTALARSDARPAQHHLGASYPNPCNSQIFIPLDLRNSRAVSRLLWEGPLRAGSHRFVWDGRGERSEDVATGVYLYRLEVGGRTEARKTTKLR